MKEFAPTPETSVPKEIERKWSVDPGQIPRGTRWDEERRLVQAYLQTDPGKGELRIRSTTVDGRTSYEITHKSAPTEDGLVRTEETKPLSEEEFTALLANKVVGNVIEKTRRTTQYNGATIEYDEYHGALAGLHVAEVEFSDETAAREFDPPAWLGADITSDASYKNASLARNGLPR